MPRISAFYGVVILMYFSDHNPPHFHAEYGEYEGVYAIETLETLRGELPGRAHAMVVEWALAHRSELRANWRRAVRQVPLVAVPPLK
jgi:hypothetical protein